MRRLTILDPRGGKQPMWNDLRTVCVVFNGEIYNSRTLRADLESAGHRFQSDHSDTEVLVHGYEEWGTNLFRRLNGMFAVVVWDGVARRLVVARDRLGEKPLYIARIEGGFAVASELKALSALPAFHRRLDLTAVRQYLSYDYILGPRTIFSGVEKLSAAEFGIVTPDGLTRHQYWAPQLSDDAEGDEQLLLDDLDCLLDASVRERMIADVPVGLFLSGGLDSTTVGYYMTRHGNAVHSFSIGFEEAGFDESGYAAIAAASLGTEHHVEVFSQSRAVDLIPRIADILDEPMGDPSIFPTHLLSLMTRRDVAVALGGDGSDELLMGYEAYKPLKAAWLLDGVGSFGLNAVSNLAGRLPVAVGRRKLRAVQFARLLRHSPADRQLRLLGALRGEADWLLAPEVRAAIRPPDEGREMNAFGTVFAGDAAQQTIAAYLRGYLQEDILVKVDRASMAASLEVRSPFLDTRLTDFLLALPTRTKLSGLTGKYLLRRLMRGRIPDPIIDRPKVGFGFPLSAWMRDSLAPLMREVLSPSRLAAGGLLCPAAVNTLVQQHLTGQRDRGRELWLVLQLELWRERWAV
jgi:asparagine synthase (glutamine-hydrolysing)